ALLHQRPEQLLAAREVAVERHRRDAHPRGDAAHGDRGGTVRDEQVARLVEDAAADRRLGHVYGVYFRRTGESSRSRGPGRQAADDATSAMARPSRTSDAPRTGCGDVNCRTPSSSTPSRIIFLSFAKFC